MILYELSGNHSKKRINHIFKDIIGSKDFDIAKISPQIGIHKEIPELDEYLRSRRIDHKIRDISNDPYVLKAVRFFDNWKHKMEVLNGATAGGVLCIDEKFMEVEEFQCNVMGRLVFDVESFMLMIEQAADLPRDHKDYRTDVDMIDMIEYVRNFCELEEFTIQKKPVTFYNRNLKKVNGVLQDA
jgi:hypothetical protein